jgi:NhaP-type Na+/H+ or K+/H+ antiporter
MVATEHDMEATLWFLIAGGVLVLMALAGSVLKRLPLSASMLYLAVGFCSGPHGLGLIRVDPISDSGFLLRITEAAVIVSLFTAGLKLRVRLTDRRWWLPIRLAFVSMVLTVGLVSLVGVYGIGLSLGASILLGAILAPTDPVLASDVQLEKPTDRDQLRFGLTGEAGFNDGSAFPFVMLGLGLLGLYDLGQHGWRWWGIDLVWAVLAGLAVGALMGTMVAQLVLFLRRTHREAIGLDNFLALGLIALSYGAALLLGAYGFLAVFAAGLALRRVEMRAAPEGPDREIQPVVPATKEAAATDPDHAPAYMAEAVLDFNEQVERIVEVMVVVLLGGMLSAHYLPTGEAIWFVPLLLIVLRPLAVGVGLIGEPMSHEQRLMTAWFGIRGVGSLYYLAYAIEHGLPEELARKVTALTLTVIITSIIVHGISVTPLMNWYRKLQRRRGNRTMEPEAYGKQ